MAPPNKLYYEKVTLELQKEVKSFFKLKNRK